MKSVAFCALLFFLPLLNSAQVIEGIVLDSLTKEILPFVHVGVQGENIGVISDDGGRFKINLEKIPAAQNLYFSIIGYATKSVDLKGGNAEPITIELRPMTYELSEIVVKPRQVIAVNQFGRKKLTKMTTGQSGRHEFGFGGEWGLKIKYEGQDYWLEDINFHTRFNTVDSALFRLNVYELQDNLPGKSLLNRQIFVKSYKKDKWISKNVRTENLVIDKDIVVTCEFVQIWYSKRGSNALFYTHGSGYEEGVTFSRDSSFDDWKTNQRPPLAMYLTGRIFK